MFFDKHLSPNVFTRLVILFGLFCSFAVNAAVPGVPSLSVPSADSDGRYSVSWGSVSNITRYELVGEQSGTLYSGTGRSSSRSKPNGTYYYKVRACNNSGCSAYSGKKGIRVSIPTKPATPVLSVPSSDNDGRYTVSWGASSGATRYELQGELSGVLYSGAGRSVSRFKSNGTYYYKVKACNSAGCSSFSSKKGIVVNIPLPTPLVPASPAVSKFGGNNIKVSWNTVTGADHYYRQVSINGGAWQNRNKYTSTSVIFYNQQVRSYRYRVQACNAQNICSGYSNASATVTVLPIPAVPVAPTATLANTADITVTWQAIAGAAHYYRQVSINGGAWQNRNKYTSTRVTLYNQQIRSYRYKVQACNGDDVCSDYSLPSNTVTLQAAPVMAIAQFEWIPATAAVGENTAFHWNITNADKCYAATSQAAHAASGQTTNYRYNEPAVHVTQWYCKDVFGNRFPADENQFLEATRTITAEIPPPPISQIIFVHTDLLGTPVIETQQDGAEL